MLLKEIGCNQTMAPMSWVVMTNEESKALPEASLARGWQHTRAFTPTISWNHQEKGGQKLQKTGNNCGSI